ncbi:hypothetical protein Tco_0982806 [Tanacetum coccineum]
MDRAGVRYGSSTKRSETLDADGAQRYSETEYSPIVTSIRDLMLKLCHRLIACSIARRSQATKKVFKEICFEEEARALISRGQFVASLAVTILGCLLRMRTPGIEAPGPKRQPDAAAGAPKVVEGAHDVDEGAQAVPTPVQGP